MFRIGDFIKHAQLDYYTGIFQVRSITATGYEIICVVDGTATNPDDGSFPYQKIGQTRIFPLGTEAAWVETGGPAPVSVGFIAGLIPMSPSKGPPFPSMLNIYWPWYNGVKG